ncbi:MAG: hypothetical protein WD623_13930 [Marinobacter sp.]|uniref:hypothetical protein n=1 Tax=Marinobacter sp. TaxID=50741 RepID=UPI0034A04C22
MEDWQGCLSPLCQTALQHAKKHVLDRGGLAITVEDYLLALIDSDLSITSFLRRRGVDIDELTRTVQCEQPIVTAVNGEGLLSSQIRYWFATARELSQAPWIDWPLLLKTLVNGADRLAGKAYVAVLEQVDHWPFEEMLESAGEQVPPAAIDVPAVITDATWLQLAEDVAVALSAWPRDIVWVTGPPGCGKTSWLQSLTGLLDQGFIMLDLRREADIMASGLDAYSAAKGAPRQPVLILDNISPADVAVLMADHQSVASQLIPAHDGAILLLSDGESDKGVNELEARTGRRLSKITMPSANSFQNLAILSAHQSVIESQWNVELTLAALRFASSAAGCVGVNRERVLTPGELIGWVSQASARVALVAERGFMDSRRLAVEMQTLQQQLLVAIARDQPTRELNAMLGQKSIERAATEVNWHERREAGTLRQVTVDDLKYELTR